MLIWLALRAGLMLMPSYNFTVTGVIQLAVQHLTASAGGGGKGIQSSPGETQNWYYKNTN